LHEDDRCFESRLQAFFNWYLFDRRLDGVTPAQLFLQDRGAEMKAADKEVLMGFTPDPARAVRVPRPRGIAPGAEEGAGACATPVTRKVFDVTERGRCTDWRSATCSRRALCRWAAPGTFHSFTYHRADDAGHRARDQERRSRARSTCARSSGSWERMSLQADRFRNVSIEAIYNFESPFPRRRKFAHA